MLRQRLLSDGKLVTFKIRPRRLSDGSIALARKNKEQEAYYDKIYIRFPNARRWCMKSEIWKYENQFVGPVHIVGKGPSLDNITSFTDDFPIIAINESVRKIEQVNCHSPLFMVQVDGGLLEIKSERAIRIVNIHAKDFYTERCFCVNPAEFHAPEPTLSVLLAMGIARMFGATSYEMWAFDACVIGNCDYAVCIEKSPLLGGDPSRFIDFKRKIVKFAKNIPINWRMP